MSLYVKGLRGQHSLKGNFTQRGDLMNRNFRTLLLAAAMALSLLLAVAACNERNPATNPTATVTVEVPSGKEPDSSVRGTVSYREDIPLTSGARLEVDLRDTTLQDAAAPLIARQVIEDPGQAPIAFEVEYNRDDIDDRNIYSILVSIIEEDGRLAFVNDTSFDVITRGNPDEVDIPLVLVQPPPELAAQVEGDHRTWVERPPEVIRAHVWDEGGNKYIRIEYFQSDVENCARPGSQGIEVAGREIAITFTLQQPPETPWDSGCGASYVELDNIERIPAELESGEAVHHHGQRTGRRQFQRAGREAGAHGDSGLAGAERRGGGDGERPGAVCAAGCFREAFGELHAVQRLRDHSHERRHDRRAHHAPQQG